MRLAPTITFRNVRHSNGLEADILRRVQKLETYFRPITSCRVLVEFAQRRHGAGNRYHVRIDLTVPTEELLVKHEASLRATARALGLERLGREEEPDPSHKYARVAIRDAFDVARRRLLDFSRRRRGTKVRLARRRAAAR
jgi:ribosome-associated translation inhibitor RaiA